MLSILSFTAALIAIDIALARAIAYAVYAYVYIQWSPCARAGDGYTTPVNHARNTWCDTKPDKIFNLAQSYW